ncbi:MAG: 30S ribosomal protein S8e [Candidatus Bathyarchaeota archaeon]|nr:30S ribosomal protein S8e [Candidatus Bathyarchaeota archaeon]
MSVWHGDLHKKKAGGGRRKPYRKKRKFETGSFPTETTIGEEERKKDRRRGGNTKVRVVSARWVNVSDPSTGRTEKAEIKRVLRNPANAEYNRRGVITKGTIIETSLGTAQVTSRPGQSGVINAVLINKSEAG